MYRIFCKFYRNNCMSTIFILNKFRKFTEFFVKLTKIMVNLPQNTQGNYTLFYFRFCRFTLFSVNITDISVDLGKLFGKFSYNIFTIILQFYSVVCTIIIIWINFTELLYYLQRLLSYLPSFFSGCCHGFFRICRFW